jgi:hypothetical protein
MLPPAFDRTELALDSSKCVFINCPLDSDYAPLFDAIVFATVACGFIPRSALESGTVCEPRVARITRALFTSKYSIHDLSRCTGQGDDNIARFNMPLELGMAMACRFLNPAAEHDWLVLVPAGHAYQRFLSDLAAYDPTAHDGSAAGVVAAVMSWLATRKDAVPTVTPQQVLALLPEFRRRKQALNDDWGGFPPWREIVLLAIAMARRLA